MSFGDSKDIRPCSIKGLGVVVKIVTHRPARIIRREDRKGKRKAIARTGGRRGRHVLNT